MKCAICGMGVINKIRYSLVEHLYICQRCYLDHRSFICGTGQFRQK